MSARKRALVTVFTGLLVAGSASVASADNNHNLADPPMVCGSAPLSSTSHARPCVTDQQVKQRMVKHETKSTDLVDYAVLITPLDVPVG